MSDPKFVSLPVEREDGSKDWSMSFPIEAISMVTPYIGADAVPQRNRSFVTFTPEAIRLPRIPDLEQNMDFLFQIVCPLSVKEVTNLLNGTESGED